MSVVLDKLSQSLVEVDAQINQLKQQREELRQKFFKAATANVRKNMGLSKKAIPVPESFFLSTKMSVEHFVDTRYPGWVLVEHKLDKPYRIIVMEEDPDCKPWSYTNSITHHVISKQIAAPPVELDEISLRIDQPGLWTRVMKPVTTWQPDAAEIQKALKEDPTLGLTLQFHTKYTRQPTRKLGPIRVEKEED